MDQLESAAESIDLAKASLDVDSPAHAVAYIRAAIADLTEAVHALASAHAASNPQPATRNPQ